MARRVRSYTSDSSSDEDLVLPKRTFSSQTAETFDSDSSSCSSSSLDSEPSSPPSPYHADGVPASIDMDSLDSDTEDVIESNLFLGDPDSSESSSDYSSCSSDDDEDVVDNRVTPALKKLLREANDHGLDLDILLTGELEVEVAESESSFSVDDSSVQSFEDGIVSLKAIKREERLLPRTRYSAAERRNDLRVSEERLDQARRSNALRRRSLDESHHSLDEAQKRLRELETSWHDDIQQLQHDLKRSDEIYRSQQAERDRLADQEHKKLVESKLQARRDQKRRRMEKVRERVAKEEAEKARLANLAKQPDMSDDARRQRVYDWYIRTGMPKRESFEMQITALPPSSLVTLDDVDLLPWDSRGYRVNVVKVNRMLRESFMKKSGRK